MLCDRGDLPLGKVVPFFFPAYDADGESVTITDFAVTDIETYKGTSMTQRSSDNGYALLDTDGVDLDGNTGIHGFSIDFADNSDSGFWAADSFYHTVVNGITVNGQTVRFVYAYSLGMTLRPTTAGRTLTIESDGMAHADVKEIEGSDATNQIRDSVVDDATRIDASALNTLSSHDPGETIMGATDLGTGAGLTSLASQASVNDLPTNAELATALDGLNDLSEAQVNAQVDAAIETYHLDHLLANAYDPASKPGAADALLNVLVENDSGVPRITENALEQAPTGGSAPTAEEIADEVRTELTTELGRIDATISSRLAPTTAGRTLDVNADGEAGIDWGNVGNKTTTHNLSGTTVGVAASVTALAANSFSNTTMTAGAQSQFVSIFGTTLTSYGAATAANVTTAITSILAKLLKYVQIFTRKDAAVATDLAAELTEINANTGTGTGAFDNSRESLEAIRDRGDAAWTGGGGGGGPIGPGAIEFTIAIDDGDDPIPGADVWISTDAAGDDVVAGVLVTDAFGEVTFMLDAGTYYRWVQKSGFNFSNPAQFTVS